MYDRCGELIYERFLDIDALHESLDLCLELKTDVVAYAGDGIFSGGYCEKTWRILEMLAEPFPIIHEFGLKRLQEIKGINKLIIIDDEEHIQAIRPLIEQK